MQRRLLLIFANIIFAFTCLAQEITIDNFKVDYANPQEFTIGGIEITGVKYLNKSILVQLTGLSVGQKIMVPGDELTEAVKKLWKQGLFSTIDISITDIIEDKVYLEIHMLERPRLSEYNFHGIKKAQITDLEDILNLKKGSQVTDNVINNTKYAIKKHYIEKGFLNTDVEIIKHDDTSYLNMVKMDIHVKKNKRVKILDMQIEGNSFFSEGKVRRSMKETKKKRWYGLFKPSKYISDKFEEDKKALIAKYNSKGYRDAKIITDSIWIIDDKNIGMQLIVDEGKQYFFSDITWVGNTKYPATMLTNMLGIKKGDVYNQEALDNRLSMDEDAVGNLYLDNGYLLGFSINPVEVNIDNDSIDLEIRIFEGPQATFNKINISGNNKTNDHVIRRELRTYPGELFSKSDIVRSVRELAQLGHFDPEKIVPTPTPNPANGTVDLDYSLEEKSNDQVEISGGWGAGMIVGTIGLKFSNFAVRNLFKKDAWRPVPSGDGQTLSLRAQTNGDRYQYYNVSFVEPWLGGKKPRSFSVSLYKSLQSNGVTGDGRKSFNMNGASIGLGTRLKWPDDYFTFSGSISFQQYALSNWTSYFNVVNEYGVRSLDNGRSNNLALNLTLQRSSIDNPIFPRGGSSFSLSLQITPPYSLFREDNFWKKYTDEEMTEAYRNGESDNYQQYFNQIDEENTIRYNWVEYHKWSFESQWYNRIWDDLILRVRAEYGFLGYFDKDLRSPFEGYYVGGDGMTGYSVYGRDIVSLRGYEDGSLTPSGYNTTNLYTKYTMELRYPLTLQPSATIYALAFLEGGNTWIDFNEFHPFDIHRSAGVGARILLPMIGLIGIDWAYGFDPIPGKSEENWGSQFHFVLGQEL